MFRLPSQLFHSVLPVCTPGPSRVPKRPFPVPSCDPHAHADAITFWQPIKKYVESRLVSSSRWQLKRMPQNNAMKFGVNRVSREGDARFWRTRTGECKRSAYVYDPRKNRGHSLDA